MSSKLTKYLIWAPVVALAGCGGTQNPPLGMPTTDTSGLGSGALGTGPTKGSVAKKVPDLGIDASLNDFKPFGENDPYNESIDRSGVDANSDKIIAKIGADKPLLPGFGANSTGKPDGKPFGIPYVVVSGDAPRAEITFANKDQSDGGPYPFPQGMPVEQSTEGHAIVFDRDGLKIYEASHVSPDGTAFKAAVGAVWDARAEKPRKAGWLSADPSGLPVFPGLVRYDEVNDDKEIDHALRFTLATVGKGYVAPATRSDGSDVDPSLAPMGMHLRLKKSFDISKFPDSTQVILKALKKYGMILSDEGTDLTLSGAPDQRWKDADIQTLSKVKASDFEVVKMGAIKGLKPDEDGSGGATTTSPGTNATKSSG